MVTDSAAHGTTASLTAAPGAVSRAIDQLRQLICGLHGHDSLLHFEKGRMSLQCTSCGYETPGWDLKRSGAPLDQSVPKARILRIPVVGQRRVA